MIHCFVLSGQNKSSNKDLIDNFFEDIFLRENQNSNKLYKKYIANKCRRIKSKKEKIKAFEANVDLLRENNLPLINKSEIINFHITIYKNSTLEDLLKFDKRALDNIYIVSNKGKVISYVLVENSKIKAFNTVQKGSDGLAFFIDNF